MRSTLAAFLPILFTLSLPVLAQQNEPSNQDDGDADDAPAASASSNDQKNPLRYWASLGPAAVVGANSSWGARLALGIDYEFSPSPFFAGFYLTHPFAKERIDGRFAGTVNRTYFMANGGAYVWDKNVWVRGAVGLGYLSGSNRDISAKLKPAFGVGAGTKVYVSRTVDIGLELMFEHSGKAKKSINFLADDIECTFGDCDAFGEIPRANIWSLNFVVGFKP